MWEMQETQAWSLGWEDPLEEEMQPPPVFLPEKFHGQEDVGGLQSMGPQRVMTERLSTRTLNNCHLHDILFPLSSWKVMKGPSLSLIIPFVLKTILSHVKKSTSVFLCFVLKEHTKKLWGWRRWCLMIAKDRKYLWFLFEFCVASLVTLFSLWRFRLLFYF